MKLSSTTERVVLSGLVVAAIVGATVAIRHAGDGHDVAANAAAHPVVATQPVPVRPADVPQPGPTRISIEDEPVNISPKDEAAFTSLAESEVSQLHEGFTLAQWTDLHGTNEGWAASTDENFFDCRTFVTTETLPSGRQITRTVYFYPPDPPTPAVFPTVAGDVLIDRSCTLALIRVQMRTPAERDGRALAQALQQQLAKKYGDSIGMKGAVFGGAAAWEDAARWKDGSEIVSAYNPTEAAYDREDTDAGSVFVFARLPVVYEIEQNACCRLKAFRYRSIENAQFHRALRIAGVDAALAERVAKLYEDLFRGTASPELPEPSELKKSRAVVLPVLRDWLTAVKTLTPASHAAGLYVADRLLVTASDNGWGDLIDKDKTELRSGLEGIGASFRYDTLGGCYEYSANWLNEARELDPEGAVGQMAVLVALARGDAPRLGKDKDKDQDIFHTVVADGEWLLA